jgi:hypothetical protein
MSRITLGERLVSAALGAVFGAIIGFVLAWLFGVYSQTMGSGSMSVQIRYWIAGGAGGFALLGFIVGSDAGTLIGTVFGALLDFEDQNSGSRAWPVVVVLLVVLALWWWF